MSPFILITLEINKCLTAAMHAGISMASFIMVSLFVKRYIGVILVYSCQKVKVCIWLVHLWYYALNRVWRKPPPSCHGRVMEKLLLMKLSKILWDKLSRMPVCIGLRWRNFSEYGLSHFSWGKLSRMDLITDSDTIMKLPMYVK